jgi:protein SCO1/2
MSKNSRTPFSLFQARVLSTMAITALFATFAIAQSGSANASMKMPKPTPLALGQGAAAPGGGSFLNAPIPANVLNIPLVDSSGKSFTLGSLKGQTVVIANFLTSCHEICPMTSIAMRDIGDAVAASPLKNKVKVLELSVDGARDTPSRLTAYQSTFADNNWTLASGSDANLTKFWAFFGSSNTKTAYTAAEKKKLPLDWQTGKPSEYDVSHTDMAIIVDAKGTWSWLDLGNPNPGKSVIPTKLKKYLSDEGLHNLAKPQEPSWDSKAVLSALSSITGMMIK